MMYLLLGAYEPLKAVKEHVTTVPSKNFLVSSTCVVLCVYVLSIYGSFIVFRWHTCMLELYSFSGSLAPAFAHFEIFCNVILFSCIQNSYCRENSS